MHLRNQKTKIIPIILFQSLDSRKRHPVNHFVTDRYM